MTQRFLRFFFIMSGLILLLPAQSMAETPFPTIHNPKDETLKCVQPEDVMRRDHMDYILHQRDQTVYEGIRTETYSLAVCIDCHIEPGKNGEIARHDEKEHFCNGCHEYASVQIDCFECHADRPQKYIKRGNKAHALQEDLHKALAAKNTHGGNLYCLNRSMTQDEAFWLKQPLQVLSLLLRAYF